MWCSDAAGRVLVSSAKQLPGSAPPVSGRIFDGNGQVERHARQLQKHPALLQRQQPVSVHRRQRTRLQQETGERTNVMHTLTQTHTHNRFTAILLFPGPPGEPAPEENFWTLWCRGRLTEADTQTIWLGATPSGLTSAHLHHPPFYRPDALPAAQPTVSKHWRKATKVERNDTVNKHRRKKTELNLSKKYTKYLATVSIKRTLKIVKSVIQIAVVNSALSTTECFHVVMIYSTLWEFFSGVFLRGSLEERLTNIPDKLLQYFCR